MVFLLQLLFMAMDCCSCWWCYAVDVGDTVVVVGVVVVLVDSSGGGGSVGDDVSCWWCYCLKW